MKPDHGYMTRLGHWLGAASIPVLILSGLEILRAFPSFFAKLPARNNIPLPEFPGLGGWLGGALAWHYAFAWIFLVAIILQFADLFRGGWRRLHLSRAERSQIWPMARFYFLRGDKPAIGTLYNPLQKLAYIVAIGFEVLSLVTGFLLLQPALSGVRPAAAWQVIRALHFVAFLGFVLFLPGHLFMVAIAGRKPILSMLTGETSRLVIRESSNQ
jgi:thiosulfate reductase cytochrome b subunit